ncbi:MAG: hypothetical protein AABX01_06510 [Candidatus Micrarchaeota archaeon]
MIGFQTPKTRGQTALEYVMIIGGAIMFVVLVVIILRSGILSGGVADVQKKSEDYQKTYLQNYLVFENFNTGTSKKWSPSPGPTIQNGRLKLLSGEQFTVQGTFTNFTLEATGKRTGGGGKFGVILRSLGTRSYQVYLDGSNVVLIGNNALPASVPALFAYSDNIDATLKVAAYSNNIEVFVNGVSKFKITNADAFMGSAGVYTDGVTSAEFDSFRISK